MAEAGTISPDDPELNFFTDDPAEAIAHIHRHAVRQFGLRKEQVPKPKAILGERAVQKSEVP